MLVFFQKLKKLYANIAIMFFITLFSVISQASLTITNYATNDTYKGYGIRVYELIEGKRRALIGLDFGDHAIGLNTSITIPYSVIQSDSRLAPFEDVQYGIELITGKNGVDGFVVSSAQGCIVEIYVDEEEGSRLRAANEGCGRFYHYDPECELFCSPDGSP